MSPVATGLIRKSKAPLTFMVWFLYQPTSRLAVLKGTLRLIRFVINRLCLVLQNVLNESKNAENTRLLLFIQSVEQKYTHVRTMLLPDT